MNLNSLKNIIHINKKNLSGIETVKRVKLQNTVGKQILTLAQIRRKLLIVKEG